MNTGSLHTTPRNLKKTDFTLKTRQMFSVQNTSEDFKSTTISDHFGFVIKENSVMQGNHMAIVANSISKSSVYKMFSASTRKRKAGVFKVLRFEVRFRKALFS